MTTHSVTPGDSRCRGRGRDANRLALGLLITGLFAATSPGFQIEPGVLPIAPDETARTSTAVAVLGALNLAHTAQFLPVDETGAVIAPKAGSAMGPAEAQTKAVLDQLEAALKEAGTGIDRLVKVNLYAARADVLPVFRARLALRLVGRGRPAISIVVGALPHPDALIAADAIAVTPQAQLVAAEKPAGANGGRARVAILPAGSRVWVSGQAAQNPDLAGATRQTLEQLGRTLTFLGLDKTNVVQLKAFLQPASGAAVVEREMAAFFGTGAVPPLVFVDWRSGPNVPIEIELIAAAGPPGKGPEVEYLTPPALPRSPIFSRVARVNRGDLIYVSGLFGTAGTSGAGQVESIFGQLRDTLAEARSDLRHLVKATYYVADDEASRALNDLRPTFYDPKMPPAASKAVVPGVGLEGRTITLDMIAVRPRGGPATR